MIMTFEVPSALVLLSVISFASLQAVTVWQLRVLMEEIREYKTKLSEFRDRCEQEFLEIELNCVKQHGG